MVPAGVIFIVVMLIALVAGFLGGRTPMARNMVCKMQTQGVRSLSFSDFMRNERGDMVGYAIELTVTLVVLAVVFIPIGYKNWQAVYANKTTYGVTAGSTDDTLMQYLSTLAILGFFLAFVYAAKARSV